MEASISTARVWADQLSAPFFMEFDKSGSLRGEAKAILEKVPDLLGTNWEALIWIRVGQISPAHELVQDAGSGIQAYIHGMIHRLEGDYWNAKYWFRSAGRNTVDSVVSQVQEKASGQLFDPSRLVDQLEQLHKHGCQGIHKKSSKLTDAQLDGAESFLKNAPIENLLGLEWGAVWSLCGA